MSLEENCPDFEKLSAWYDNESKNDSDIKQTESKDGQATLDDIKKIDVLCQQYCPAQRYWI